MSWNSSLQLWVWGWPGQHFWQLTATAGERNATNTYLRGKDIFPLFALTVFHYSPQTIFMHSLILSGAAPWHEGMLLRLPWMGNSPFKTQFFLLCPSAVLSHAHQEWWYFEIFQLPNSHGVEAYVLKQAMAPPWWFWWTWGFSLASWILGVQNTVGGSISCLIN